jgi:hypothetical protein
MADQNTQQLIAKRILERLDVQQVKGRVTRTKRAIDMLAGAVIALDEAQQTTGDEIIKHSMNMTLFIATMVSTRGVEYLDEVANAVWVTMKEKKGG